MTKVLRGEPGEAATRSPAETQAPGGLPRAPGFLDYCGLLDKQRRTDALPAPSVRPSIRPQSPPFLCALNSSGKVTSVPQPGTEARPNGGDAARSKSGQESRCPENGNVLMLRSSSLGLPRGCVAACDLCVPISFNKAQANIVQLGCFLHPVLYAGYYGS